jgi:hypothetical protein
MSDAKALLTQLEKLGIAVTLDRDGLRFHPAERLPPELRQAVAAHRHELAALLRAHQLADTWATARTRLEQLVLAAAERKSWPYLELRQGTWLLPGKAAWTAYVTHACTAPDTLVNLLESLSRK